MAIYLIDYENVYIEGLRGLEYLTEEDSVHIFYTRNRCGLTFDLYEQLICSRANVNLNEVAMSLKNGDPVKNALDIQLTMFAGYVIGAKQTTELYIVSRDKDFLLGMGFYEQYIHDESITMKLIPDIASNFEQPEPEIPEAVEPNRLEEYTAFVESIRQETAAVSEAGTSLTESFASLCDQYAKDIPLYTPEPVIQEMRPPFFTEEMPMFTAQYRDTVRSLLDNTQDETMVSIVCDVISDAETLVDLNNGLAKRLRDGEQTKKIYHRIKPRFEDLTNLSRAIRKSRNH